MKILITGGAGYVGQALIQQLCTQIENIEILIYDNLSRANYGLFFNPTLKKKPLKLINAELLDSRTLKSSLKGIDVVYHLAAKVTTPFADLDSHYFEQVNHWGTAELVNLIEEQREIKHFINLSSLSVYGMVDLIEENTIPNPTSFYGISKLRAERHIHRLFSVVPQVHIIRSGNVYGYNSTMRMDAVINRFIFEANFKNRITIHGNGAQKRAFIHVNKLAEILAKLPISNVPNGTFSLAEHNFSVNEIGDYLKQLYPNLETLYMNQHIKMQELVLKTPCKINEYITYQPQHFTDELLQFKAHFAF